MSKKVLVISSSLSPIVTITALISKGIPILPSNIISPPRARTA